MLEVNISSSGNLTTLLHLTPLSYFPLITLNILIIIGGLGGNLLVLTSSFLYNAVADKADVTLLSHLAVTDIIVTLVQYVPMLATLLDGRWRLGSAMCLIIGMFINSVMMMEGLLVMTIACYRCSRILAPLAMRWQHPGRLAVVLWVFSLLFMSLFPVLMGAEIIYFPPSLSCILSIATIDPNVAMCLIIISLALFYIPMIVIIIANSIILKRLITTTKYTGRHGKVRKTSKATLTIALICWVYIISVSPAAVATILHICYHLPAWFTMATQYAVALNVVSNPVIYTVTNKKFAGFVLGWLRRETSIQLQTPGLVSSIRLLVHRKAKGNKVLKGTRSLFSISTEKIYTVENRV